MSRLLEDRKEKLLSARVNLAKMIEVNAYFLMEDSIVGQVPHERLVPVEGDEREEMYIKPHIVMSALVMSLGNPPLGELATRLKVLAKKYPPFAGATENVQVLANAQVAVMIRWNNEDIALLTKEVGDHVQHEGDASQDPIRDRINRHVSVWLNQLFGLSE